MNILKKANIVMIAALLAAALPLTPVAAATTYYSQDTDLVVGSTTLQIAAGSAQESLTVSGTTVSVKVPADEIFILRTSVEQWISLENDAGQASCNVLRTHANQLLLHGPVTANVTLGVTNCSTAGYDTNNTPFVNPILPAGGESLKPGQVFGITWQTSGVGVNAIRLRLSVDGGLTYPTTVVSNLMNNGYYGWTVPDVYAAAGQARLKFDGMDGGGDFLAVEVSPAFAIAGTPPVVTPPPPVTPPTVTYDYDPAAATQAASTISIDKGFVLPAGAPAPACAPGLRIKGKSHPAVYFCGADGKRHAFPNQRIHDSWYNGDFNGVVNVSDESLASIPLGPSVTYRPGVRLVKIQTDPKVYVVAANAELRWVPTEDVAKALYGNDWNKLVDDVPDAFFQDYHIGNPIE